MKGPTGEPVDIDAAFLPWRMNPDSLWLHADLSELHALAEYQSNKALALARECLDAKDEQ